MPTGAGGAAAGSPDGGCRGCALGRGLLVVGPGGVALDRAVAVAAELANLRAAHRWSLDNDPGTAVRIAGSMFWYAYWYGAAEAFAWGATTAAAVSDDAGPALAGACATPSPRAGRRAGWPLTPRRCAGCSAPTNSVRPTSTTAGKNRGIRRLSRYGRFRGPARHLYQSVCLYDRCDSVVPRR